MCGRGRSTYTIPNIQRYMNARRMNNRTMNPGRGSGHGRGNTRRYDNQHEDIHQVYSASIPSPAVTSTAIHPTTIDDSHEETEMIDFQPIENVSPGMELPVVHTIQDNDETFRVIEFMKWGLIPSFSKNTSINEHYKMFNARIETIDTKISFKRLINKNRCVVLFNGFYEWKGVPGKKTPYYISLSNNEPLILPGLYDVCGDVISFTILTCDASECLKSIHDRQPVMLSWSEVDQWLDLSIAINVILKQLKAKTYSDFILSIHEVSRNVTNPKYQGKDCSLPVSMKQNQTYFSPVVKIEDKSARIPIEAESSTVRRSNSQDSIHCPICDVNISSLSETLREQHVNSCLDNCQSSLDLSVDDLERKGQSSSSLLGKRYRYESAIESKILTDHEK